MSPAMFLLSIFSILTVWVITSLGLPPNLWTFGVVPSLSIYFLFDHGKLWETAIQVSRWPGVLLGGAIPALFYILYVRFVFWRLFVLLACLFCTVKAFDVEKKMYMGDRCGEMVKSMVWKLARIFISETERMKYKGEWTYCSPYSRKSIDKDIDHYFTLQSKDTVHDDIIPESYEFDFGIEDCRVVCNYTNVEDDHTDTSGDYSTQEPAILTGPGHEENVPSSSTPGMFPLEKMKVETSPASEALGESSSSMAGVVDVLEAPMAPDCYTLKPSHVSKLEVSLRYENERLESYTFLGMRPEAVAEVKRVLEILRDQGNLIFASLNRNVGSGIPQAHARCYEFGELFELVLIRGFTLHEVNLPLSHSCRISGASATLQVLNIGLVGWMNFYQITHTPSLAIAISLVSLIAVIQLLTLLVNSLKQAQHKLKRCVHYIISKFAPEEIMQDWYRYFQVHYPCLTFCNESYGYPYASRLTQICYFENTCMCLPIIGILQSSRLKLENLVTGYRVFDLKNLVMHLNLVCDYSPGGNPGVTIDVRMLRKFDNSCFDSRRFHTDGTRAANLIALMQWLEKNSCAGVCKEWPKRELMHAYRYEEILMKVLNEGENLSIIELPYPMAISVEGV